MSVEITLHAPQRGRDVDELAQAAADAVDASVDEDDPLDVIEADAAQALTEAGFEDVEIESVEHT